MKQVLQMFPHAAACPDLTQQTGSCLSGLTTSARVTQTGDNMKGKEYPLLIQFMIRRFQLPCPGGVCSSRELPSCTDSIEWEEEGEVNFENCQELSFKGASVLCGLNGTKHTTKRLLIGGGVVEEVVATPCNDCGDLSAGLEWTAWMPCADKTSGRVVEGMLCRRRGNTYLGFEEEEKGKRDTYF